MQSSQSHSLIRRFLGSFLGSLGLILFPVPLGPFRHQLVGRVDRPAPRFLTAVYTTGRDGDDWN